jgi:hypothetical protein
LQISGIHCNLFLQLLQFRSVQFSEYGMIGYRDLPCKAAIDQLLTSAKSRSKQMCLHRMVGNLGEVREKASGVLVNCHQQFQCIILMLSDGQYVF